jgi:heat shock protein HtpX
MYGSRIREYYADLGSVQLGSQPHFLATALYKISLGSAKIPKKALKQAEGMKTFFLNDPSRSMYEIRELKDIDIDMSGTIDQNELMILSTKNVRLSGSDKIMEILSTHPNMVKRIKNLATLSY